MMCTIGGHGKTEKNSSECKVQSWSWRDGSVAESTYFAYRGPGFNLSIHMLSHNHLYLVPGI